MHLEDFDRGIELLEQQGVDMKRARNALLPLLRLPDEVVLCVVKLLRDDSDPAIPLSDTLRGWSSIFQTCSRMRKIRLSSQGQQLWANEACLTPANLIEANTMVESALDSGRAHSEPQLVDYEGMGVDTPQDGKDKEEDVPNVKCSRDMQLREPCARCLETWTTKGSAKVSFCVITADRARCLRCKDMAKGCTLSKVSVTSELDAWFCVQHSTTLPKALLHNSHSTAPPHRMISKALSSKSPRNPSSRVSTRDSSYSDAPPPRSLPGAQARRDVIPLSVEPRRVAPRPERLLIDADIERLI